MNTDEKKLCFKKRIIENIQYHQKYLVVLHLEKKNCIVKVKND